MRALRTSVATLCFLFVPFLLIAGEGQIRRSPNAVKGEYIVVLNDSVAREDVPAIAHQVAAQHGGSIKRIWQDALKGYFALMTEAQAQALSHNPNVKYVEENARMFLSARVPTNVDPACDYPSNCTTSDNRLWHLDVLDQNDAVGTHDYAYCTDGSGVYVYIVDTGVMRAHREFNNDPNRVADGYNASGDCLNVDVNGHCLAYQDYYPAYDPCHGSPTPQDSDVNQEVLGNSHGTGVGSVVAGRNIGVAKNATIVPIKVTRCGEFSSKLIQRNTTYPPGVIVRSNDHFYRTLNTGTTGPSVPNPCCSPDGTLSLQFIDSTILFNTDTVQMSIEGLDWILRPVTQGGNPYPKSPAVVSLSTFRVVGSDGDSSFEDAITSVLLAGITVIASANNQDANACDTSPGRMSRNNPNNPNDPNRPYKVITAGGTMLRNNPDSNPATGGASVNLPEPAYNSSKATLLARWRCNAGDSDTCSANIYSQPPPMTPSPSMDPTDYSSWNLGSNGGQCVTLFAPAKNIPVANISADSNGNPTMYRDSRATAGLASGTSWSAPFVAGVAARILQSNPTYSVDQVYSALMGNTTADLDPTELDPPGITGTPNALLHIPDVSIAPLPATITGPVTASASGTAPLTYQWYLVNSNFVDHSNDAAATPVAGATSGTLDLNPRVAGTFFVRVASSCGSADSTFTTFPCQTAAITSQPTANPSTVVSGGSSTLSIGVTGTSNVIQWFNSSNVFIGYGASILVTPTATTTYYALVSNPCTSTLTSANVTVTVCFLPAITSQPTATPSTIDVGGSSTLSIAVSGATTIQWFNGTTAIGTGTSIVVSPAGTTVYHAVVSNSCGSVTSANVKVTVCSPGLGTTFTATPSTISAGQTSKLEVGGATGTATLTYLWFKSDGTQVGTSTNKKLNVTPSVTTSYYYKVSNSCGTTGPSTTVTVTVQ